MSIGLYVLTTVNVCISLSTSVWMPEISSPNMFFFMCVSLNGFIFQASAQQMRLSFYPTHDMFIMMPNNSGESVLRFHTYTESEMHMNTQIKNAHTSTSTRRTNKKETESHAVENYGAFLQSAVCVRNVREELECEQPGCHICMYVRMSTQRWGRAGM